MIYRSPLSQVALNKLHDLLFFVCDMLEFAFMGRVASLEPQLVATLMTLQASAFNFSDAGAMFVGQR